MKPTEELKQYGTYLYQKELSEGTRKLYLSQAQKFLAFLGSRPVVKEEMIAYKKSLSEQGLAVSTVNLYIVAVNSYLKFAGYGGCRVKTRRTQKRRSLENVISMEEYRKMLAYAKESGREKYYFIMKTLALTGIRISELQYFTVETLGKGVIRVDNKGKSREVYLPDSLIRELRAFCRQDRISQGVIFTGRDRKPISRTGVYKMLVHMADMIGIPKEKAHPHSFRHLFALTFMSRYQNLSELSDILGHSSLETTRIYTVTTAQEKRRKLNSLGL